MASNNTFKKSFYSNEHLVDELCHCPQLASSSLLRLGQEVDKEMVKNRESVYLLLDQVATNPSVN